MDSWGHYSCDVYKRAYLSPKSYMSHTMRFQAQNFRFVLLCLKNKHLKQIMLKIRFIDSSNIYYLLCSRCKTTLTSCTLSTISFIISWTSWVWVGLIDIVGFFVFILLGRWIFFENFVRLLTLLYSPWISHKSYVSQLRNYFR